VLIDVRLPELAESVVEGEVVRWLVAVGAPLLADQPLLEVMTDKVSVELPTPVVGVLREIVAPEGAVVPVGGLLARVEVVATAATATTATTPAAPVPLPDPSLFSPPRAAAGAPPLPTVVKRRELAAPSPQPLRGPFGRVVATPAARRRARERGIGLTTLVGSGPDGRVRSEDVLTAAARGAERGAWPPPPPVVTPAGYAAREHRTPLRGVRKRIKEQMVASHLYTVRTLHVDEVDVSALQALRGVWQPAAAAQGVKLSPLPFILKGIAALLPAYPALRSALDEGAGEVVVRDYLNFGVAVDTPQGLIVPVVRDVETKSLLEVARELQEGAAAARAGTLPLAALQGGSFTVTNIGAIGGLFSFPIIHAPEAAILGVHSIRKRAVVLADDTIAARPMLYLSLSFDHRLVDGADAARFTRDLIALLADPRALPLG
jgi:2-oxoisovalerate dehydrogenase E2 component (dihydrolipoyl transacylase)